MSAPALDIRLANPDDMRLVRASWFESYRGGGHAPEVQFPIYKKGMNEIIERCLKNSKTFVAYATAVPDEIASWVCVEPANTQYAYLIHYVYTKQDYRRMGIADRLVTYAIGKSREAKLFHTHDTGAMRRFAPAIRSVFNPYPLFNP